jgi:hypothetical protein
MTTRYMCSKCWLFKHSVLFNIIYYAFSIIYTLYEYNINAMGMICLYFINIIMLNYNSIICPLTVFLKYELCRSYHKLIKSICIPIFDVIINNFYSFWQFWKRIEIAHINVHIRLKIKLYYYLVEGKCGLSVS